jgi:hypothetical protein
MASDFHCHTSSSLVSSLPAHPANNGVAGRYKLRSLKNFSSYLYVCVCMSRVAEGQEYILSNGTLGGFIIANIIKCTFIN